MSTHTRVDGCLCTWNRGVSVHASHDDDNSQTLRRALCQELTLHTLLDLIFKNLMFYYRHHPHLTDVETEAE